MIAMLRGEVALVTEDWLVLEVGGVGYRVFAPASLLGRLAPGESLRVHVSTQVREDAILLYGFESAADRETFLVLLGISGVGPRIALSVLSTLGRSGLAGALVRGDERALQRVSGVGKRLAQRLITEMAGKVLPDVEPAPATVAPSPARAADPLPLALAQLGYRKAEIDRALAALPDDEARPFEERIRAALGILSGGAAGGGPSRETGGRS
jgi:Holliday junction DNA helicase RuvA